MAARVERLQETFRKSLENTNILEGINLLTGKERAVSDHEHAGVYDEWVASRRQNRKEWEQHDSKSSKNG